jgi:hypothetical protein
MVILQNNLVAKLYGEMYSDKNARTIGRAGNKYLETNFTGGGRHIARVTVRDDGAGFVVKIETEEGVTVEE